MNEQKKNQIVEAIAKMDTTDLERLVINCGGTAEALKFLESFFLFHADGNTVKTEAAQTFLKGIEKQLIRIERQKQGEQILLTITQETWKQ